MSHRSEVRAFTLLEMMVVIAIIGTLALVVGPSVVGNVGNAKAVAARSQIEILSVALESYRVDMDCFPTTEQGIRALRENPGGVQGMVGWRGPYVRRRIPSDPWGRPYVYRSPGTESPDGFDLFSLGRDGLPGGEGEDADVTSWGEPVR